MPELSPSTSDRDFRVFCRAARLMRPAIAAPFWLVIARYVLPVLWELIKAWLESRAMEADRTDDPGRKLRAMVSSMPAESEYLRAWRQAERETE
jgi:hypothetical protein